MTHVYFFVIMQPAISGQQLVYLALCQSGDLIEQVRHVLGEVQGGGVKTDSKEQNTDDTAIVQSVGAPFAALQWREEDSLNNFRCEGMLDLDLCF